MNYKIIKFTNSLYLVSLTPGIPGFKNFIGTWVYKGNETFIVDVGPAVSTDNLWAALQELEVKKPDYILLTHIHIDHAGGIGEMAEYFPDAKIVCHPKGIPHLVDPEKLIKGSIKTLGETARIYGPIKPVKKFRFLEADTFTSENIHPVITPGHAPHHVSFITKEYLFAGETGGVYIETNSEKIYLRPATPPRFFLDTAVESIDKLIQSEPETICYGHFGMQPNATELLKKHKNQIYLWNDIIKEYTEASDEADYYPDMIKRLLETDPLLEGFQTFNDDVKGREEGFIKNAIMGFTGYLKEK